MLWKPFWFALSACVATSPVSRFCHSGPRSRTLFQLESQRRPYTAFENQAFRPDGSVIITSYTNATIWQLNPPYGDCDLSIVTNFDFDSEVTATLGIVETTPDTFYFATSNFNSSFTNFTSAPGSNKIYRLSFPSKRIELAATVEDAQFLNGLTKLNDSYLLAADSQMGAIWGIDLTAKTSTILVLNEALAPYPELKGALGNGINGLKYRDHYAHFSNTIRASYGRVSIDPWTLETGRVQTITNFSNPERPVEQNVQPDDLVISPNGDAYVSLRSEAKVAKINARGQLTSIIDLGESFNATSLSLGVSEHGEEAIKEKLFATGVFGKYFEFNICTEQ